MLSNYFLDFFHLPVTHFLLSRSSRRTRLTSPFDCAGRLSIRQHPIVSPFTMNSEKPRTPDPETASRNPQAHGVAVCKGLPPDRSTASNAHDAATETLVDEHSLCKGPATRSIASSIYSSDIVISPAPAVAPETATNTAAVQPPSKRPQSPQQRRPFTPTPAYQRGILRSYKKRLWLSVFGLQFGILSLPFSGFYVIYAKKLGYGRRGFTAWFAVSLGLVLGMVVMIVLFKKRIAEMKDVVGPEGDSGAGELLETDPTST
jgi:hypothetical protein